MPTKQKLSEDRVGSPRVPFPYQKIATVAGESVVSTASCLDAKAIVWLSWGCSFKHCLQDSRQQVPLSPYWNREAGGSQSQRTRCFFPSLSGVGGRISGEGKELGASIWRKESESGFQWWFFSCPLSTPTKLLTRTSDAFFLGERLARSRGRGVRRVASVVY